MQSSLDTKVLNSVEQFKEWRHSLTPVQSGKPLLGLVPTMGALHEGHLQLVERAREECAHVAVSIFVNPLQFAPHEDFSKYPRPFAADLEACRKAGVEAIFHPSPEELYGPSPEDTTRVIPPVELLNRLDGLFRPGHFEGVATVVMKLFGIVEPSRAYFGQKDFQQLTIVQRLVRDLNVPLEIVPVATVRESDGLALSSRNVFLTAEQRSMAPELHKALLAVRDYVRAGKPAAEAEAVQIERLTALGFDVQYLDVCDAKTLEKLEFAAGSMVVLIAAKLGAVRLIDNLLFE